MFAFDKCAGIVDVNDQEEINEDTEMVFLEILPNVENQELDELLSSIYPMSENQSDNGNKKLPFRKPMPVEIIVKKDATTLKTFSTKIEQFGSVLYLSKKELQNLDLNYSYFDMLSGELVKIAKERATH